MVRNNLAEGEWVMLILRLLATLVLILAGVVISPTTAYAGCKSVVGKNDAGIVTIKIVCEDDDHSGEGLGSGKRVCMWGGVEVPCVSNQGRWYSPFNCYISRVDPPPPYTDDSWRGHREGSLWYCRISGLDVGTPVVVWLADSTPPPDPEQLAREAVRNMQLKPITIGIVPERRPRLGGAGGNADLAVGREPLRSDDGADLSLGFGGWLHGDSDRRGRARALVDGRRGSEDLHRAGHAERAEVRDHGVADVWLSVREAGRVHGCGPVGGRGRQ